MGDRYRVLHFCDGELIEKTEHETRDAAEGAFALGVEHANQQADEVDIECRVELWGEDSVLAMFDTADRP